MSDEEPAAGRSAFRAFVREHHPDRGGDPETFTAGMARFTAPDAAPETSATPPPADSVDTTVDVSVDVSALPFPVRVGVALIRTWHRVRHEQADPPGDQREQRGEP